MKLSIKTCFEFHLMKKSQIIRYLANEVYSNHPFEIEMCEYYHSKGVFFREMK